MNHQEKMLFDQQIKTRHPWIPYPPEMEGRGPMTDRELIEMGYIFWMMKGDELYGVIEATFGKGRVCKNLDYFGSEDFYCYESLKVAIEALSNWDPETCSEIQGWFRNFSTSRRRTDGDPEKEYYQQ